MGSKRDASEGAQTSPARAARDLGSRAGSGRRIGLEVRRILDSGTLQELLDYCNRAPARKVINSLIQAFYRAGSERRWWAVTAFGIVAARIAEEDMERARILMRRLMWSLNDESGGIGWGAPEAMAEAMANVRRLAEEYCRILLSYIREDGNFLEHRPLRRGALWGIMRLAQSHPDLFSEIDACTHLAGYLSDPDPESRALAALAAGFGRCGSLEAGLKPLLADETRVEIWCIQETGSGEGGQERRSASLDAGMRVMSVGQAARFALERLSCV